MKKKVALIVYAITIVTIILLLLFLKDLNDMIQLGLGGLAIILTSIFTYSSRR